MKNPIKPNFKTEFLSLLAVVAALASSFFFYNNFPDRVPTHWNVAGEVDGWSSPFVAAFVLPLIILGMYLMFLLIPVLDPKKDRYEQFVKVYHIFKTILVLFMAVIYFSASFYALGYNVPVATMLPVMIGALFILIGNYMSKIKMNWFMGIRTPWTLSSEEAWNKTHRFGGKLFMLSGIILAGMNLYPADYRGQVLMSTIIVLVFGVFLYSYIIYSKETKKKKNEGSNN